ncbi:hypothetical protein CYLTODRAFT_486696 [Cylindrobasidium torrendii FP15055 ss-10]|uniref:Uncharacterized protein n=1 Tax=Cylindrobasidium torrendii FP15055 ss-10 TaxID=1314674 RepID=A0A0D7BR61_9AGAR|nr:hypothetical protein CYLTODRAFT_486696 [Cylindrobasidium torrendii FP15055 ss-10]
MSSTVSCSHCCLHRPSTTRSLRTTRVGALPSQARATIDSLRSDLVHLETRIETLRTALIGAETERDALRADLDAQVLALPPIHNLPNDVLCDIFQQSLSTQVNLSDSKAFGPWVLKRVCHRWRNVVQESASLWASFSLGEYFGGLDPQMQQTALRTTLDCSKKSVLDVSFNSGWPQQCLDTFSSEAQRVRHLTMTGYICQCHTRPFLDLCGSLPILNSLDLNPTSVTPRLDPPFDLTASTPLLRRLKISDSVYWVPLSQSMKLPYQQITHLELAGSGGTASTNDVLSMLNGCGNLEVFKDSSIYSRISEDPPPTPPPIIAMPNLVSLEVADLSLLQGLTCPALVHLKHLGTSGELDDKLQHFLERSKCSIESLDISVTTVPNARYAQVFAGVTKLGVHGTSATPSTTGLLPVLTIDQGKDIFPKLSELRVGLAAPFFKCVPWKRADAELDKALADLVEARWRKTTRTVKPTVANEQDHEHEHHVAHKAQQHPHEHHGHHDQHLHPHEQHWQHSHSVSDNKQDNGHDAHHAHLVDTVPSHGLKRVEVTYSVCAAIWRDEKIGFSQDLLWAMLSRTRLYKGVKNMEKEGLTVNVKLLLEHEACK